MTTPSSGQTTPVDYGVQIRFINDYQNGGGQPAPQPKSKTQTTSKYGVAVRVQGIAGQPYVVLKDGQKGDSYGVQLKTEYSSGYNSLPRAQSHGSLLNRDGGPSNEEYQLSRPPGDGKSGSYGNLDGGIGVRGDREQGWHVSDRERGTERNIWHGSYQAGLNRSLGSVRDSPEPPPQPNELHSNKRQTSVNKLINRFDVTPDLLLDQGQSAELSSEEEQAMKTIYNILRQSSETDVIVRHKVKLIFQNIQHLKSNSDPALKAELESCLDENLQLQEMLDRKKNELNETQSLTHLRMDRENAEKRVRDMEDQMAEFQDELRRKSSNKTDLVSCQAQLMEVLQLKKKLEETLRQRERELTALKGALKEEVASHDKEIEALREQYSADMDKLRSSMEQVSQSHAGIEAERLRVNASVRSLQQQLEDCRDDSSHWMEQFHSTRDELRTTKQLLQTRLEKEEFEEELKELQDKMTSRKQQTPDPSHTQTLSQELQQCKADLQKGKSEVEKMRVEFDKKVMEVISLKKSHQNQEAELKYEIDRLKGQLQKAKEDFAKAQEKNKRLPDPATISELEQKLNEAQGEVAQLKKKLSLTEEKLDTSKAQLSRAHLDINSLQGAQQEQEEATARLKEKISRLESSEAELALHTEVRGLRSELDEAKRKASRLSQEHRELSQRLEDTEKDKEALKQTISQLEDTKQQQERALEKLNKDYDSLNVSLREETQALRVQLEEQKERARKEVQEVQRHENDAHSELEKSQMNIRKLEEEKKELLLACEERDNHQLDKELLANRLRHLEGELEASKNSHNEKTREIRILEIDQLRSELMQERSSKQDLELDKNAMERHLKELRSRVVDMEGQSRSSVGVSQLESKIQELEDRLRSEEEKNAVLATQRRLERKLKDLNMTLDEERQTHTEQRDQQLALRVKALKRQVDEGETELERLDGIRRKAQRDLEEQMELKEALQTRVTALETELRRKTQAAIRPALDSSALSSDDDDSLYDSSTITSILTESNLQTSSC
uniref:Cingulin n=1 Tax=Neolamprologus brichardi TaxID=32507 RepID=A0A3Q4GCS3_NEOBR